MNIYSFNNKSPRIDPSAFIFENATIIGDVVIGKNVSVWPGVTIRGDKEKIIIEDGANIQEHSILHTDPGYPLLISENVTVGHNVVLHGCSIGRNSVIGIGSTLLNGVKINENCLITAGSLISAGPTYPANSMISGNPAKVLMEMQSSDIKNLQDTAKEYMDLAKEYRDTSVFYKRA